MRNEDECRVHFLSNSIRFVSKLIDTSNKYHCIWICTRRVRCALYTKHFQVQTFLFSMGDGTVQGDFQSSILKLYETIA